MDDGAILLATHYRPRVTDGNPPLVLIRSPYGRSGLLAVPFGRVFAERGFQVFIQSCRGTDGSGGEFYPQRNEQRDGLATLRWLREQSWCGEQIVTAGMSYLGYTQWAMATDPSAGIAALALNVTMADFGEPTLDGGAFGLQNCLGWSRLMAASTTGARVPPFLSGKKLQRAMSVNPLQDGDTAAAGHHISWYQDWLNHTDIDDPYWQRQSHRPGIPGVTAPISMLTGWYDLFLPWMLRDYEQLRDAGNPPELTIGPWRHADPAQGRRVPATAMRFFRKHLQGESTVARGGVQLFVTGDEGGWRELPSWPPPTQPVVLRLSQNALGESFGPGAATFRYDPRDPTPSLGGPTLAGRRPVSDNSGHESRDDVVTFDGPALSEAVEVIGTVAVTVRVSAGGRSHDVFARLCDVDANGKSLNVADRLVRLPAGDDGPRDARLELWPCAHRFATGHRMRLQLSGGAHPRYARHPGSDGPLASATLGTPIDITIHHEGSEIVLPVSP